MELIKQTDEIRVESENEAKVLIESFKDKAVTEGYDLINYSITLKEKKQKGKVIDSYYIVKVIKRW